MAEKTEKTPKPFDPGKPLLEKPESPIPGGQVEPMAECEDSCVSQAEQYACGCGACMIGCQLSCQVSCQSTCQTSCQTSCQLSCQGLCEVECQLGCAMTCQSCTGGCQTPCELGCQVGCEVSCQTGCEVNCQTTCELSCQIGCEVSCTTYCESHCTDYCESHCTDYCESHCTDYCESYCTDYCESHCTATCETSCQGLCEVECQLGCAMTCQYCTDGCETPCEVVGTGSGPQYREVARTNCEDNPCVFDYAVCAPDRLDLVWDDAEKVLSDLMASYSGTWVRASNSNYFFCKDPNSPAFGDPYGYVLKNHQMLKEGLGDGKKYDGWWISDPPHVNTFVNPTSDFIDSVNLNSCWLGINVGPILIQGGSETDLPVELAQAYDTSILADQATRDGGEPILRAGMGWSPQYERIIHVFCKSGGCSLYDLQDFFMEFPGIWGAIAFDGGGSVGVIDKEVGTGVMGYNTRPMKTAFVMTGKDSIPLNFPS